MENRSKIKLAIDGKEVVVGEGTSILDAARQNDIYIPTLCHHDAVSAWGGCRLCVVEVDGAKRLGASCTTPVREGMEVVTSNDRIIKSRQTILEFLFAERNHNCMFCPQSGDCELQKLAYELQMDHLTLSQSFKPFPTDVTNEYMVLDHNRCVLCGRCIRACHELAGAYVLNYQNRGPRTLIGLDLNASREASTCYNCGVCMQVCPTGAISNRYRSHYTVKGHGKDREQIESFCPQCGFMCPVVFSVKDNGLIKIEGKLSPTSERPDRGQLCYKGRFDPLKTRGTRLLHPMVRKADGTWVEETWPTALDVVIDRMSSLKDAHGGGALFGLASGRCSNEELALFRLILSEGLGVGSIDALDGDRFRVLSGAIRETGKAFKEASWKQIAEADFILAVGADPCASQPMVSTLMRKSAMSKGNKLGIIGETDFLHPWTTFHLPVKNKDNPLLIKAFLNETGALVRASSEKGEKSSVADLLKQADLEETGVRLFHEMVDAFAESNNPIIIVGESMTGLADSSGLLDLMTMGLCKGLLPGDAWRLIVLKRDGNSAGAWRLLLSADNGVESNSNPKGGLLLLGGEDTLESKLLDRLTGLEFLAVLSPLVPEALVEKAHVMLPKPLWLEESGSYTSLDGLEVACMEQVLSPPPGVKGSWQTLASLAERTPIQLNVKTWKEAREKAEKEMNRSSFPVYRGTV